MIDHKVLDIKDWALNGLDLAKQCLKGDVEPKDYYIGTIETLEDLLILIEELRK